MNTQKTITLDKSHNVASFASKDGTRPIIAGVYVDVEEQIVAATDGRHCIEVPIPSQAPELGELFSTLEKDDIKTINLPSKSVESSLAQSNSVNVAAKAKKVIYQGLKKRTEFITVSEAIEGDYPNYRKLFEGLKITHTIRIAPYILRNIAEYAYKNGDLQCGIKIGFDGEIDPVSFEIKLKNGNTARVIAMPIRA